MFISKTANISASIYERTSSITLGYMLPAMAGYAAIMVVERILLANLNFLVPIESMHQADIYSTLISHLVDIIFFIMVGLGVLLCRKDLHPGTGPHDQTGAAGRWILVVVVFVPLVAVVDVLRMDLQFMGENTTGEAVRGLWLLSLYVKLGLYYVAMRLLIGALGVRKGLLRFWSDAWRATTTGQSLAAFVGLLLLHLVVTDAFVTFASYVPVIAPFWFIPNELSSLRYLVGQGTRILAESVGVAVYVAFWLELDRRFSSAPDGQADRPPSRQGRHSRGGGRPFA